MYNEIHSHPGSFHHTCLPGSSSSSLTKTCNLPPKKTIQQTLKTSSHYNIYHYRYIVITPPKKVCKQTSSHNFIHKQLPTKNQPTSTNQPQLLTADRRLERVVRPGWHASVSPAPYVTLWQSPLENVAPERGEKEANGFKEITFEVSRNVFFWGNIYFTKQI